MKQIFLFSFIGSLGLGLDKAQNTFQRFPSKMRVWFCNHMLERLCCAMITCLFGVGSAWADLIDLSKNTALKGAYFIPQANAQDVEVYLYVPVGEVDREGPEGASHYLEHLVAWSADRVHGEGLRNRMMNAWASPTWTAYYNIGEAAALEDMIRHARAVFDPIELPQDFIMTERDVVEREFDLNYRGFPTRTLSREAYHHLYQGHGLGRSVMGTIDSIRKIDPDEVLDWHQARYDPAQSYLLIYGPAEREEVFKQIKEHLGEIPTVSALPRGLDAPLNPAPTDTLVLPMTGIERAEVIVLSHAKAPDGLVGRRLWATSLLLADVLNGARIGGLPKPLYYDTFTVTEINVRVDLLFNGDLQLEVFFKPEDEVTAQEATLAVQRILTDLAEMGLSEETFEAVRDETRATIRRMKKDRAAYARQIAQRAILSIGEPLSPNGFHYEMGQPTIEDLNSLLRAFVGSPHRSTAIAEPEKPE